MARAPYSPVASVEPSTAGLPFQNIQSPPEAFGADVGRALQRSGEETQRTADETFKVAMQYQQMNNETEALNASTKASAALGDIQNNFRQLKGLDAAAALPGYQQKIQELQETTAQGLRSPAARLAFMRDFRSYADRANVSMGLHAGDQMDVANIAALNGSIAAAKSRAVQNAATSDIEPDFNEIINRVSQLGAKQGLPKEAVDAMVQKHLGDVMKDVVTSRIAAGDTASADRIFQKALHENAPGTDVPLLDGDHIAAISQTITNRKYTDEIRAEREQARQDRLGAEAAARTRVYVSHTYDNAAAMVQNGHQAQNLPSDEEIDRAYPKNPDIADEVKQKVSDLRQISGYLGVLPGATPEQVAEIRAKTQPDPNDQTNYAKRARLSKALDSALDIRNKAIKNDPAGYVVTSDAGVYQQLQAAIKDPKAFPDYAQSVLSQQTQMGVPESARSILPAPVATAFANDITKSAENAPQKLKQMEAQYGAAWPHVFRDMVTLGKLPAEYQSVAALDDERDASLLARAINEQGKSGKPWSDILGTKPESDIKTAVRSDPSVMQLASSLSKSGASVKQVDGVINSINMLAYAKSFYNQDTNAAANAIASFTSKYEFMPNGGARVPAKQFDAVSANAHDAIGSLDIGKIQVPAIYGMEGMPKPDDYVNMLKAAPSWITSPSADSLMLMDPMGRLVRDKRGVPITVPFNGPPPARRDLDFVPAPALQ